MKYLLILFSLFTFVAPAVSLSFDDAMSSSSPFVFYMYQDGCSACRYFDSIYDDMQKKYSTYFNFVRQNADTSLSKKLIAKWQIETVPYVLIINPNTKKASKIPPYCFMDEVCMGKTLKSYR